MIQIKRIELGNYGIITAIEIESGSVEELAVLFGRMGIYIDQWHEKLPFDVVEKIEKHMNIAPKYSPEDAARLEKEIAEWSKKDATD